MTDSIEAGLMEKSEIQWKSVVYQAKMPPEAAEKMCRPWPPILFKKIYIRHNFL